MIRFSKSNKENLSMSKFDSQANYEHSWWRIALIILAFLSFVLVCAFNGLASTGPNGVFSRQTGRVSDNNLTEFTPAGWTFSIWGLIYFWQAAWLLYAFSRIPRKSNVNYLYISPNTLHFTVFLFYIINMILNIVWLILWDRLEFGWATLVIFLMFVTVATPMIITHILLQRNRSKYIECQQKKEIWLVRLLVHNGLAIYFTWLFLASLLNLTIWIAQIYERESGSIINASTAALSIVLVGIIVYFICENFIFYSAMAYTFIPWFVFIFALSGVASKNSGRGNVSKRNHDYVLALLIISCVLFVFRLIIFIVRYFKKMIPTLDEP